MDEISHLWIPRSQLPTYITQSNEGPGPLSSTLICYMVVGFPENGTYPSFIAYDYNLKPLQFDTVLQADALQMHPSLATMFNSSFQCIDLAGLAFTYSSNSYFVEILTDLPVAFALQVTSYNDVIKQSAATFFFNDVNNDYQLYYRPTATINYDFLFTSAQIADSLWPNADQEIVSTFANFRYTTSLNTKIRQKNDNTVLKLRTNGPILTGGDDFL